MSALDARATVLGLHPYTILSIISASHPRLSRSQSAFSWRILSHLWMYSCHSLCSRHFLFAFSGSVYWHSCFWNVKPSISWYVAMLPWLRLKHLNSDVVKNLPIYLFQTCAGSSRTSLFVAVFVGWSVLQNLTVCLCRGLPLFVALLHNLLSPAVNCLSRCNCCQFILVALLLLRILLCESTHILMIAASALLVEKQDRYISYKSVLDIIVAGGMILSYFLLFSFIQCCRIRSRWRQTTHPVLLVLKLMHLMQDRGNYNCHVSCNIK